MVAFDTAKDGDLGPLNAKYQVANSPLTTAIHTGSGAQAHQSQRELAVGLHNRDVNAPEDFIPSLHTLHCESPEPIVPKWHRANSRRTSFGRPSPVIKAQRTSYDGESSSRVSLPHFTRFLGRVQDWIDTERGKVDRTKEETICKAEYQLSLARLQQVVHESFLLGEENLVSKAVPQETLVQNAENYASRYPRRKRSSLSSRKLGRAPTFCSDTENEADRLPSAVDSVLDNSKTLSYANSSSTDLTRRSTNAEAWHIFKTEIVRLAHTLKLKGWRRVPLERGDEVEVQRLSGALTNAVYVVSPPQSLPEPSSGETPIPRPPPSKLLLRIYGPRVEHLIDRESELAILRRLARKNIGPKLLGTFTNGRFEEFLNAKTLTANDIREPTLSRQIAKRMRELHVGIRLLPEEREAGPFVWQNWDKWKERCEEVIEWLDEQIKQQGDTRISSRKCLDAWRERGHVCGVEWKVFRTAVRSYRSWLEEQYGGRTQILDSLIFAHNDTQYGNLLRLMPDDKESPLLQPANEHRRLVVIDFEYANANTPGFELANHFSEWCYNYHSNEPSVCVTEAYPSIEEQKRFAHAYINHVPHFQAQTPGATPILGATPSPYMAPISSPLIRAHMRGSVSNFMLDSRAPPSAGGGNSMSSSYGGGSSGIQHLSTSMGSQNGSYFTGKTYEEEEKARDEAQEKEISRLLHEARLWRVACSAQWVAWGIVQAKVPGMEAALQAQRAQRVAEGKLLAADESKTTEIGQRPLIHDTVTEPKVMDNEVQQGQEQDTSQGQEGETGDQDDEEDEFDYLAYSQDRAMFFWGDMLSLGLVREEDLPADLVAKAKRIDR